MTLAIKQALAYGRDQLPMSDTAELDSELILLFCLKATRNILFTHPQQLLSETQYAFFKSLIERRIQGEPVAYIIGTQGFWNLHLNVAPHTLIPRPDTESLIDWVLEKGMQPKHILDLGTGTGALALAFAQEFPHASVLGLDVIPEAVALAQENKKNNQIKNADFKQSDWFAALQDQTFDLIVSNPPYIDKEDEHLSQGDVRFEPSSALVADNHGLADLFYIAKHAKGFLTPGGCLLMEHGWQQANPVRCYLTEQGYKNVGSGFDFGKNERFTFGLFK